MNHSPFPIVPCAPQAADFGATGFTRVTSVVYAPLFFRDPRTGEFNVTGFINSSFAWDRVLNGTLSGFSSLYVVVRCPMLESNFNFTQYGLPYRDTSAFTLKLSGVSTVNVGWGDLRPRESRDPQYEHSFTLIGNNPHTITVREPQPGRAERQPRSHSLSLALPRSSAAAAAARAHNSQMGKVSAALVVIPDAAPSLAPPFLPPALAASSLPQVSPAEEFIGSYATTAPRNSAVGAVFIVLAVAGAFSLFDRIASGFLRQVIISSIRQHASRSEAIWAASSRQAFASTVAFELGRVTSSIIGGLAMLRSSQLTQAQQDIIGTLSGSAAVILALVRSRPLGAHLCPPLPM